MLQPPSACCSLSASSIIARCCSALKIADPPAPSDPPASPPALPAPPTPPALLAPVVGARVAARCDADRHCRERRAVVARSVGFPRLVVEVQPRPRSRLIAAGELQRPHVLERAAGVVAERAGARVAAGE